MKSVWKSLPMLALALGLAIVALPASAQQQAQPAPLPKPPAGAIAIAKELILLRKNNEMYQNAVAGTVQNIKQAALAQHLNMQKELDEVAYAAARQFNGREAEMTEGMAEAYARQFTEPELKDLIVFYKSALGQKLLAREPMAIQESVGFMKTWGDKFQLDVVNFFRTEMKKRGKDI
ncbi:MAG: DUF2059 domain-containing protein [Alphaproteobacteria bacterium]|nr:DUF2059 domain-containing protein [Alphaproteobacteria bacterium]